MAKVVFITLYDKGCIGVRYISSFLKERGHDTDIIYLGRHEGKVRTKRDSSLADAEDLWVGVNEYGADLIRSYSDTITEKDIGALLDLLKRRKPAIVGFSLRTMFLNMAILLAERIRSQMKVPIIYGGVAPTCEPERCIRYADMICIGEGERGMAMVADWLDKGGQFQAINNIWFRQDGSVYKSPALELEQDLDNLPFPDYEAHNKFSILNSRLIENDPAIGNGSIFTYDIITSRGCPFTCTYCCNELFRRLYPGQKFLRRRTVKNVIDELRDAKNKLNIKSVLFKDEIFTFDLEWVKGFCASYRKEIGLPFWCNTHPSFANERILGLLKENGMFSVTMGIQSGSDEILYNVFNRTTSKEKILNAAVILEKLRLPMRPRFDMITNNPFETEDDRRQTLELLMKIPKPVNFGLTKLSFIPGTRIIKILQERSLNTEIDERLYKFWNSLYLLTQYRFFPNFIIRFLNRCSFLREKPILLQFLLFPKFLEVRLQDAIEDLKNSLPSGLIVLLKGMRRSLKGY